MLYGDLSLEDLKKERVRIETSLRNGVKTNKWKKASVPASYVLEAITPAPAANAKVAKPKLGREPAVAKAEAKAVTATKAKAPAKAKAPRKKTAPT
jgi:hypothetical protein